MNRDMEGLLESLASEMPPPRTVPAGLIGRVRRRAIFLAGACLGSLALIGLASYTLVQSLSSGSEPALEGRTSHTRALWVTLGARAVTLPVVAQGAPCPATPATSLDNLGFLPPEVRNQWGGEGPVYVGGYIDFSRTQGNVVYEPYAVDGWHPIEVHWLEAPGTGPILVRAAELAGSSSVRFGNEQPGQPYRGQPVSAEAHLSPDNNNAIYVPSGEGWHLIADTMFFQSPGCYGMQIDGRDFSEQVVFAVRA